MSLISSIHCLQCRVGLTLQLLTYNISIPYVTLKSASIELARPCLYASRPLCLYEGVGAHLCSLVTLSRSLGAVTLVCPLAQERPRSAVEQSLSAEGLRPRMSVEEQMERIRRHQQASLRRRDSSSGGQESSLSRSSSFTRDQIPTNPYYTLQVNPPTPTKTCKSNRRP